MTRPVWHKRYLSRNHANQRPTSYVFVDVETRQTTIGGSRPYVKHELELGIACAVTWKKKREPQEEWYEFEHAAHFWGWLGQWQSKRNVLWVVAHNAQFDLTILGLWQHIESGYYKTEIKGKSYRDRETGEQRTSADWQGLIAIDGSPFHVETEGPRGRVNFTDLQNYYQCSLADIGRAVGTEKGSWDDSRGNKQALRSYCRQDVSILAKGYLGLIRQWEVEDNGNWQFSAASLAHSHFRHKYLDDPIAIHNNGAAMELEWNALYGGEVRSFFRGEVKLPLVHYDVNSLYPSCMVDQIYPTALVDVVVNPPIDYAISLAERYACVAEVYLDTDDDLFPMRRADRMVYPCGQFRTTLAGPELWSAFDGRNVRAVKAMALYTHAPIFKRYVLEWWHRKEVAHRKGDIASEKFAKLMLNSLPAKFAQRTPVWETEAKVEVVMPWKTFPWKDTLTGAVHTARSVGWAGQVQRHRRPTENAFPAIYAYVTSYARERMRWLRSMYPPKSVYYQDTDSMIVDDSRLVSRERVFDSFGDGLGQLREVGRYSSCEFRGLKNYTIDGRHVIAGIRRNDMHLGNMKWNGERFERSSHLFCRNPDGTLRAYPVDIDTPGCDSEGGVGADGWTFPVKIP